MKKNTSIENKALKILILEDSLPDMELMVAQLSEAGYQLDVTHSENEAQFIEALKKNCYDIVLSDFKLPGFDAFGALEIVQKLCPEIPFICISGSIGEEKAIELLKKGAVDYVLKDRPERLPFAIKNALAEAKEKAARIKTTRKLKESENRFRQVAETAQEWIWEVDTKGMYTYASPVIESLLGYTPDEVIGKKYFYDFFALENREELKQVTFEDFARKKVFRNFENTNIHKNGQLVYILTSGSPVFDDAGNFQGYRGADEDITERKLAEKELLKLSRAVEQSPASVIVTDLDGAIEYVNPKTLEITGYTKEELIGKNPRILNSGEKPKEEYQQLWSALLSGREWVGEFHNKKKNGELYWESASISPIINEKQEIINYVAVKEDVTERKKFIGDLKIAKEKAEAADRLKTAFLNNISHEVRTPLNGILGFGQMMAESDLSQEDKEMYLGILKQSSDRLINTITDFMDISLIASGNVTVNKKNLQISQLFSDLGELYATHCEEKGLEFKLILPPDTEKAEVESDVELLKKVFRHLLNNALKFTNEGTIKLGFRLKQNTVECFVEDTGKGIEAEMQDLVFSRFTQEDTRIARGYEGSGLGLSISKGLVELLGGEIALKSEKGKGTTVSFALPRTPEETEQESPGSLNQAAGGNIALIAEDDYVNRLFMETILKGAEIQFISVENGREAVEQCRDNPDIGLVIMDLKMPVMDGLKATRRIKKLKPQLPVIAITAQAMHGDREKAINAGCNDYISKPVNKENLLALISIYFNSK